MTEPRKSTREQWKYMGRETLWTHYTFHVWTLVANPSGRNEIGQRHARFIG